MTVARRRFVTAALVGSAALLVAGCGDQLSSRQVKIITVSGSSPKMRVQIARKVDENELKRIAREMRDKWERGRGVFKSGGPDQDARQKLLRVTTTYVFFYLPHMDFTRHDAWALAVIPPGGKVQMQFVRP